MGSLCTATFSRSAWRTRTTCRCSARARRLSSLSRHLGGASAAGDRPAGPSPSSPCAHLARRLQSACAAQVDKAARWGDLESEEEEEEEEEDEEEEAASEEEVPPGPLSVAAVRLRSP